MGFYFPSSESVSGSFKSQNNVIVVTKPNKLAG